MQAAQASGRRLAADFDRLNLGCGQDYREGWLNVDAVAAVEPDLACDLNDRPWPFPDESFELIVCSHVLEHLDDYEWALEECARILKPDGRLRVKHPIGLDFTADPDHNARAKWDWDTPKMLCGKRHWDQTTGLEVADRHVTLWAQKPGIWRGLQQQKLDWWMRRYGPGRWCFDLEAVSGEFIVTFERS